MKKTLFCATTLALAALGTSATAEVVHWQDTPLAQAVGQIPADTVYRMDLIGKRYVSGSGVPDLAAVQATRVRDGLTHSGHMTTGKITRIDTGKLVVPDLPDHCLWAICVPEWWRAAGRLHSRQQIGGATPLSVQLHQQVGKITIDADPRDYPPGLLPLIKQGTGRLSDG